MIFRDYKAGELSRLHEINMASTPGVSEETVDALAEIISLSTCIVAEGDDGLAAGFITLLPPGTLAYESPNLRWFEIWLEGRTERLIYVDRIALHPDARGQRLGEALYGEARKQFADHDLIGCEVNTKPNNEGSHRFHPRLGFEQVGEQAFSEVKAVAYYVRSV